jgi:hypothetical protein
MSNCTCNDGCPIRRYVSDGDWRCNKCNECYEMSYDSQQEMLKAMQEAREETRLENEMGLSWIPVDKVT